MAKKPKGVVVKQFPFSAVKFFPPQPGDPSWREGVFDVWQWNIYKMKWVRLSNSACGFARLSDAEPSAKAISDEIEAAIQNNLSPPPPL